MRQKSKQFISILCAAACLILLTACSTQNGGPESSGIDPMVESSISQVTESLLEQICYLDSESASMIEEGLRSQRETALADGVAEWTGVMGDTGPLVRAVSSRVTEEDSDTYLCTVYAQFENRNAEFKIYYTYSPENQGLVASRVSFEPEYTLGEKMSRALLNMLLGMGLVFVILIFLCLVISCFRFINIAQEKINGRQAEPETPEDASAALPVLEEETPAAAEPELPDDTELVAVIAAAIAASEDIPADGLRVRSIRRVSGSKWKNS